MNPFLAANLIEPVLSMAAGAVLLWFPRKYRRQAQRRHTERLNQLEAGAEERYFEERRALVAYRPARSDRAWQLLGVLVFLLGGLRLYMLILG